jgi:hypothetical protein
MRVTRAAARLAAAETLLLVDDGAVVMAAALSPLAELEVDEIAAVEPPLPAGDGAAVISMDHMAAGVVEAAAAAPPLPANDDAVEMAAAEPPFPAVDSFHSVNFLIEEFELRQPLLNINIHLLINLRENQSDGCFKKIRWRVEVYKWVHNTWYNHHRIFKVSRLRQFFIEEFKLQQPLLNIHIQLLINLRENQSDGCFKKSDGA